MTDAERFLERFSAFGRDASPEVYEDLFDPEDGTVLHPGMQAPLHRRHVRQYMAGVLALLQGFRFEVTRSCSSGTTVFVEARNSATVGGVPIEWNTVYSITLRGDRVLCGRAYFDRLPVLALAMPDLSLREAAAMAPPGVPPAADPGN